MQKLMNSYSVTFIWTELSFVTANIILEFLMKNCFLKLEKRWKKQMKKKGNFSKVFVPELFYQLEWLENWFAEGLFRSM